MDWVCLSVCLSPGVRCFSPGRSGSLWADGGEEGGEGGQGGGGVEVEVVGSGTAHHGGQAELEQKAGPGSLWFLHLSKETKRRNISLTYIMHRCNPD